MCTICPRTSVQHAGSVHLFRQELTLQSTTSLSLTDFHPAREKALRRALFALKEVHSPRREHSRRKHSHTAQAPLPSVGSFITYRWTPNIYSWSFPVGRIKEHFDNRTSIERGSALPEESSRHAGEYFHPEEECSRREEEYLRPEECSRREEEYLRPEGECSRRVGKCFAPCASSGMFFAMQLRTVSRQRPVESPFKALQMLNRQSTVQSTYTSKSYENIRRHFLKINFLYNVRILSSTATCVLIAYNYIMYNPIQSL